MAFVHKNNRGSMFKNTDKLDSGSDYSGVLNIEGVHYFIDGYINESERGKFLGLSIKKKNKQPEPDTERVAADVEDDIL